MKVAIAGYGIEGQQNFRYWSARGDDVTIVDEKMIPDAPLPEGAQTLLGPGSFDNLQDFDLVIRTASLAPTKIKSTAKVWSATNEFFEQCPASIIGVTGTKGKGTTSSLITAILRAAGKTVHLVGNIGIPALEELPRIQPTDIVVYELSSFQLWDIKKSPRVAVALMIEPDHQDVHEGMDDYVAAKANIGRFQTVDDICIYHPTNPLTLRVAETSSAGTKRRYGIPVDGGVYVKENSFYVRDRAVCSVDMLHLVGSHNIENACAALTVALEFKVSDAAIAVGLRSFEGLDHRLKFVRKFDGVSYYDDSIATTPGSAIAALDAFHERKVIILGGSDKGVDYSGLIEHLKRTKSEVIAIGALGDRLAALCSEAGVLVTRVHGNMDDIVNVATERAKNQQAIVILSPAAASFDMFKNYSDRGEQFIAAVEGLA